MADVRVEVTYAELAALLSQMERKVAQSLATAGSIRNEDHVSSVEELKKNDLSVIYGSATDSYTSIGFMLSESVSSLIDLRGLKKLLATINNIPPSLSQQVRARISYIEKDLEDLVKVLTYLKEVFEAKLRFFNSAQYFMTGAKFSSRY